MGNSDGTAQEENHVDVLEGVCSFSAAQLEDMFCEKISTAIAGHEQYLDKRRLDKTRRLISEIEAKLKGPRTTTFRANKLLGQLKELQKEEKQISGRLSQMHSVTEWPQRSFPMPEKAVPSEIQSHASLESVPETDASEAFSSDAEDFFVDDGDERFFRRRLEKIGEVDLFEKPLLDQISYRFKNVERLVSDFKIPCILHDQMLGYQRTGVKWLLDLYQKSVGGILGDEMGLGKTIQIIGFIACLIVSGRLSHAALIVCPATLMKQWVQEFHQWSPFVRVILLHSSGALGLEPKQALNLVQKYGHVLVTSYGNFKIHRKKVLQYSWSCAVLDEGHKIRNPNAEITALCKRLQTPRRYVLSGTPIQNNLIELWSLFDFIYPGKLGTLPVFKTEFAAPINAGGYINASSLQIQTSYKCACLLRDMIDPYLLRRIKATVAQDLPPKQEQILFCNLSEYQRCLYERLLDSDLIQSVISGKRNVLAGIDLLRKVCNHPDLLESSLLKEYDDIEKPQNLTDLSGKFQVLSKVLEMWIRDRHRVLIFCQTRQMLNLVEALVKIKGTAYQRMDGTTSMNIRMQLIEKFNSDTSVPVFLLTTKVGGLGVNLTGADRVIIYDPDWNPSTDVQARERAWRLGQRKPVTIYRLITAGTIEEKIYHRQIFKQYLTSRILSDPKQSRFFKASDIYDIFSLAPPHDINQNTETADLFDGLELEIRKQLESSSKTDVVLDGLFEITGLHSALQHDRLEERPPQEIFLVKREASRRAQEAAEALKRSRHNVEQQSGSSGRFVRNSGNVEGLSSAEILAIIKRRKQGVYESSGEIENKSVELLERMLRFFYDHDFACTTGVLVSAFGQVKGSEAATFREMLRCIATLNRPKKLWTLRDNMKNLI